MAFASALAHGVDTYFLPAGGDLFKKGNWSSNLLPSLLDDVYIGYAPGSTESLNLAVWASPMSNFAVNRLWSRRPLHMSNSTLRINSGLTFGDGAYFLAEGIIVSEKTQTWTNFFHKPLSLGPNHLIISVGSGQSLSLEGATKFHEVDLYGHEIFNRGSLEIGKILKSYATRFLNLGVATFKGTNHSNMSLTDVRNSGVIELESSAILQIPYQAQKADQSRYVLKDSTTLILDVKNEWNGLFDISQSAKSTVVLKGTINNTGKVLDLNQIPGNRLGDIAVLGGSVKGNWKGKFSGVSVKTVLHGGHLENNPGGSVYLKDGATASGKFFAGGDGDGIFIEGSRTLEDFHLEATFGQQARFFSSGSTISFAPSSTVRFTNPAGGTIGDSVGTVIIEGDAVLDVGANLDIVLKGTGITNQVYSAPSFWLNGGVYTIGEGVYHLDSNFNLQKGQFIFNSIFSPKLARGTLTLGEHLETDWTVLDDNNGLFAKDANLSILGGSLKLKFRPGFVPKLGKQYDLMVFRSITGTFAQFKNPGWEYIQTATEIKVRYVGVPEPVTLLALATGLAALIRRRVR